MQIVFWTAVAYVAGQLVAAPAAALLEHWLARRVFHPPVYITLGLRPMRRRERWAAALFAAREFAPLPEQPRSRVLGGAAASLGVPVEEITHAEAVFVAAFGLARKNADALARMDHFRNLYGFARNLSFVGLIGVVLTAIRLFQGAQDPRLIWACAACALLTVGMYGRFLKFYASYSREVWYAYLPTLKSEGGEGAA